jgi:hypothetical protein
MLYWMNFHHPMTRQKQLAGLYIRNERITSRKETTNHTPFRTMNGILSSITAYPTKIRDPRALATSYERDSVDHLPNWFNRKEIKIIEVPKIPIRVNISMHSV